MAKMALQEYIKVMKKIQQKILTFIEEEEEAEDYYDKIIKTLNKNIKDDDNILYETLNLIVKIGNNHFRTPYFFKRLEHLILHYKSRIKETYSNQDIFHVFKSNKRLLLFLIQEKLLVLDDYVITTIKSDKYKKYNYYDYFLNEDIRLPDPTQFDSDRLIGENETIICRLIRTDSIEEFVAYVTKNSISIRNYVIKPSIFETNRFLYKNRVSLIEYAAFYGSSQIVRFLYISQATVTSDLWLYVIHGKNNELVHFLEENKIEPKYQNYENFLNEAFKCHHNDIASYILDTYINHNSDKGSDFYQKTIQCYNYRFFTQNLKIKLVLFYACKYDYLMLVTILIRTKELDPNSVIVLNITFF